MESDHNKSSQEKSPSDERRHRDRLRNLTGGIEDVVSAVSSSPTDHREETTSSGRKRARNDEPGGPSGCSGGGGQKGKKKGELTDPPSTEPKCATCGKTFGSWKAVFGHLRSHPEREYRGAFPPPKIWEEMLQQEAGQHRRPQQHGGAGAFDDQRQQELLASTLLSVARDVSAKLSVGGDVAGGGPSSGRGLGIDLNEPEEPESPRKDGFPFDLNMPAPLSEEDDDNY